MLIHVFNLSTETKASLTIKQKVFFEKMKKLPLDSFRTEDLEEAVEDLAAAVGKVEHFLLQ